MMRKNNKRTLYESIMKDAAKTIKKKLYENIDDGEDTKFTDYIQYVVYSSNDKNEYILAT